MTMYLDWMFTGCSARTPFWQQTVLGLIPILGIRTITWYSRYSDIRPYGDPTRRNRFYLAPSESTVCDVISAQSLSRSTLQRPQLSFKIRATFKQGSIILLCIYWAGKFTTFFCRGLFHFESGSWTFINKDLAVRNTSYTDNWPLFSKQPLFAVSGSSPQVLHMLKIAVIMTIRTYALYGGSKRLLTWMSIILITLAIAVSVRLRSSCRILHSCTDRF